MLYAFFSFLVLTTVLLFSAVCGTLLPISVSGELPEQKFGYLLAAGVAFGGVAGILLMGPWVPRRRFREPWSIVTAVLCSVSFVVLQHPALAESRVLYAALILATWLLSAPARIEPAPYRASARPMLMPVCGALCRHVLVPAGKALIYGVLTLALWALAAYNAGGRGLAFVGVWLRGQIAESTASLPSWAHDAVKTTLRSITALKKGVDRFCERVRRINHIAGRSVLHHP